MVSSADIIVSKSEIVFKEVVGNTGRKTWKTGEPGQTRLTQTVFQVSDHFWAWENQHRKNQKTIFFKDWFYSFKAHAHYFTIFIYLATWRAAQLGIFTNSVITNLPQYVGKAWTH